MRTKYFLHLPLLAPLGWIVYDFITQNLGQEPVDELLFRTGIVSIFLLFGIGLMNLIKRWRPRPLLAHAVKFSGWYALGYALLHLGIVLVLDYELDIAKLLAETSTKRYLYLGMGGLLVMLFMGFIHWRKKMWLRFRPVFYLAPLLGTLHYFFIQKLPTTLAITILSVAVLFVVIRLGIWVVERRRA